MRRRAGRKDIVSNDVYLNSFAMLAAVVYLLLQLINPPAKQSEGEPPPGSMSVYISWDAGPIDVDLWLLAAGEEGPVGFSAERGRNASLERDDIGTANDDSPANFENTYVRVLQPGEYIANVHCFKCLTGPVTVSLQVRVTIPGQDSKQLVATKVTLQRNREELTAIRFRLDRDGNVVPGSMHNVFKPLYSAGK